ncbi:hypothetical protein [Endozoicomonas sp. ALC066]|uniref:hypothetical protein n=1 Tax=Endozoicomonas sp. ALC066 TaxID=3403078 RepID=UPI003BB673D1
MDTTIKEVKDILEQVKEQLSGYGEESFEFDFLGATHKASIVYDTDPENPFKDWDHPKGSGIDLSNHRGYRPDSITEGAGIDVPEFLWWIGNDRPEEDYEEAEEFIQFEKEHFWTKVYMYDHGGRTVNITGFDCRWDSGTAGIAFIPKATVVEEGLYQAHEKMGEEQIEARGERFLEYHVELLDQWMKGEVYGWDVESEYPDQDDTSDSCYSYWGDQGREAAVEEVLSLLEVRLEEQWEKKPTYLINQNGNYFEVQGELDPEKLPGCKFYTTQDLMLREVVKDLNVDWEELADSAILVFDGVWSTMKDMTEVTHFEGSVEDFILGFEL